MPAKKSSPAATRRAESVARRRGGGPTGRRDLRRRVLGGALALGLTERRLVLPAGAGLQSPGRSGGIGQRAASPCIAVEPSLEQNRRRRRIDPASSTFGRHAALAKTSRRFDGGEALVHELDLAPGGVGQSLGKAAGPSRRTSLAASSIERQADQKPSDFFDARQGGKLADELASACAPAEVLGGAR